MNTNLKKINLNSVLSKLRQDRWTQVAAAIGVVMILSVVAFAFWLGGGEDTGNAPTFVVQRGPLTISVTESGTIQNRDQVVVKSRVEGRNAILSLVEEGTHVKKGDLLVELDSSRLEDNKNQQQITVLNAEASFIRARENRAVTQSQGESDISKAELDFKFAKLDLKKYIKGEYLQDLKKVNADISIATEELNRSKDKLEGSKRLAKQGYITQTELEGDQLACKRTEINLELAQGKLSLLNEFTHPRNLEQLRSDVEQAEKALGRTKRKVSADDVQAAAELKARESEFTRQTAKLEKMGRQIANCKMLAPVAGMVVYATTGKGSWRGNTEPLEEGQEIRERQELIYLPTTASMMAEVKVHESSLRKVRTGLAVRVTIDALPGKTFYGRVGKIGLLPDAQSAWLNPDLKVYSTEIHLEGDGGDLRPGMTCRAEIVVEQYDDVVYVPVQSVLRVEGRPTVYLASSSGGEPRGIQIGLDNNRMIHVLSGLTEGEKVLLAPPLDQSETAMKQPPIDAPAAKAQPTTHPAPAAAAIGPAAPAATQPAFDPSKLQNMSREERQKYFENLTPEQREQMRKQFGGRRGQSRGAGRGRRGGRSENR